jgi:hypothetical protein
VTQQHLEILSEIAELFSDEAVRTALATDPDPTLGPRTHHQLATQPAGAGLISPQTCAMLQTPLTIQRLYDDNRDSLQLGWFAGFPGGERLISGDAPRPPTRSAT